MINNGSSELDLESQETLLPVTTKFPRDPWRWIILILHVHQVFISVVSNAKQGSLALLGVSRSICVGSSSDARDGVSVKSLHFYNAYYYYFLINFYINNSQPLCTLNCICMNYNTYYFVKGNMGQFNYNKKKRK